MKKAHYIVTSTYPFFVFIVCSMCHCSSETHGPKQQKDTYREPAADVTHPDAVHVPRGVLIDCRGLKPFRIYCRPGWRWKHTHTTTYSYYTQLVLALLPFFVCSSFSFRIAFNAVKRCGPAKKPLIVVGWAWVGEWVGCYWVRATTPPTNNISLLSHTRQRIKSCIEGGWVCAQGGWV